MSNKNKAVIALVVALVAAILILATAAIAGFSVVVTGLCTVVAITAMLARTLRMAKLIQKVARFIQSTLPRIQHFLTMKYRQANGPTARPTTKPTTGTMEMPSTKSHIRTGSAYDTAKCRTCLDMKYIARQYDGQRVSCPSCQRG